MALDRFVYWGKKKPSAKELRGVLEDYLGGVGKIEDLRAKKGRLTWWTVTLPGRPTVPFQRVKGFEKYGAVMKDLKERWFEVCLDEKYVDVITRHGDEFTGVVAQGFADLLVRFYEARLEK